MSQYGNYHPMKLCAIYNVWHDWDLLRLSINNIRPCVDRIILVASESSNYGEKDLEFRRNFDLGIAGISHFQFEPDKNLPPMVNETNKRNYGLEIAKKSYTHFIMMDADEFYNREDFAREKQKFIDNPDLAGLVCSSRVYFGSPSLTIGLDTTRVPFIHRITPTLRHEFNRRYPFAWEGREIRIDPTRSLNINEGVEWSDIIMEHYSWVRKDIDVKIRNSTARANIERSTLRQDYLSAKEGYFVNFYGKTLIRASVDFNIPEFHVPDIQKPLAAEAGQAPNNS